MDNTCIKIGSRFKDKKTGDKAMVMDICTVYPYGIAMPVIEAKFDIDDDICMLGFEGFDDFYELI